MCFMTGLSTLWHLNFPSGLEVLRSQLRYMVESLQNSSQNTRIMVYFSTCSGTNASDKELTRTIHFQDSLFFELLTSLAMENQNLHCHPLSMFLESCEATKKYFLTTIESFK